MWKKEKDLRFSILILLIDLLIRRKRAKRPHFRWFSLHILGQPFDPHMYTTAATHTDILQTHTSKQTLHIPPTAPHCCAEGGLGLPSVLVFSSAL